MAPKTKDTGLVIQSRIKATVVTLACWGLIPIKLADWIIQRGGLRDA